MTHTHAYALPRVWSLYHDHADHVTCFICPLFRYVFAWWQIVASQTLARGTSFQRVGLLPINLQHRSWQCVDSLIVSGRTDQSRLAKETFVRNASLRGLSSYGLERNCQCHRESLCNQVRSQLWVGLCWTWWTIAPNFGDIDHGYLRKVEAKCMQDAERLEHCYPKSSDLKIWRVDPWTNIGVGAKISYICLQRTAQERKTVRQLVAAPKGSVDIIDIVEECWRRQCTLANLPSTCCGSCGLRVDGSSASVQHCRYEQQMDWTQRSEYQKGAAGSGRCFLLIFDLL